MIDFDLDLNEKGLAFHVYTQPLLYVDQDQELQKTDRHLTYRVMPTIVETVDEDGNANSQIKNVIQPLGDVSSRYEVVQNSDAFELARKFVENGAYVIVDGGVFQAGAKAFLQLEGNPHDLGGGDTVKNTLLFFNSHDNSTGVGFGHTPVRVSCLNTFFLALNKMESTQLRARHRKNVNEKLKDWSHLIDVVARRNEEIFEYCAALTKIQVKEKELLRYFTSVFKSRPEDMRAELERSYETDTPVKEREITNSRLLEGLRNAFESAPGQELRTARGTAWGAFNAVTYYNQYLRAKNEKTTDDDRKHSLLFGQAKALNASAFALAAKIGDL